MLEEALMIKQRVIAITGASSGIGRATALHLAQRGESVVLAARSEEGLTKLVEEIRANGGSATYCVIDVRKRDDLLRLISTAATTYGRLDVLVSNAGAMPIGPISDLAVDDWEQMVDVNIKGVLYGIAAALPLFQSQGFGHFIHTSSTAARKTVANQVVYSATKAAVLAISDGLRQELASQIRVSVITPGFTDTAFVEHVKSSELKKQMKEAGERLAMSPETVARAIAYVIDQPDEVNIGEVILRSTAQA
jgi:NADP-dependent 3-hydroxy acid dehydrogenase YdfG